MSLEQKISDLTDKVEQLTIVLADLLERGLPARDCGVPMDVEQPKKKALAVVKEQKPESKVEITYRKTKSLIQDLAPDHRDAIKALNNKYELKVFADILNDPNNPEEGVKDQDKLEAYYKDLKALA